jgi:hypothetical protein
MRGMEHVGFDLVDGRQTVYARFVPPLTSRDLDWLLSKLDGIQRTEHEVIGVIEKFAIDYGYTATTRTLPNS